MNTERIPDSEFIINDDGSAFHIHVKPEQLTEIYKLNNWGRVPAWLMAKAKKNKQKGYTQNQPDFH